MSALVWDMDVSLACTALQGDLYLGMNAADVSETRVHSLLQNLSRLPSPLDPVKPAQPIFPFRLHLVGREAFVDKNMVENWKSTVRCCSDRSDRTA